MIRSGRNGLVKWDPAGTGGVAAVALMSIKQWNLSLKTNKIDVTCFQDQNSVFVPSLPQIDGGLTGYWNSADDALITATKATTPGYLILIPDTTDTGGGPPAVAWAFEGKAYLDAEINTAVDGAPELTGQILAAGPWTLPNTTP